MDMVEQLLIIPGIFVCVILWWAQKTIDDVVARRIFSCMVVLFLVPYLLHYPDEHIEEWLHHLPFYTGEVFYYFFLRRLIERYNPPNAHRAQTASSLSGPALLAALPLARVQTLSNDWFAYITDEGFQHVLTIPLMLLVVSGIRVYLGFVKSPQLRQVLSIFLFASVPLMMIHILEFLVESQHLFPLLAGDPLEVLEYFWNIIALMVFAYGLGQLQQFTSTLHQADTR